MHAGCLSAVGRFAEAEILQREAVAWKGRTVMLTWDAIFIAAGAIMGLRVCLTMLISGTLCWAVFVPFLQHRGIIAGAHQGSLKMRQEREDLASFGATHPLCRYRPVTGGLSCQLSEIF